MRAGRRSTIWCSARCSMRGRRAAIAAAERHAAIGGRILEVGVGTGISLPDYARAQPTRRRRSVRADAAQGARARRRARLAQCRSAGGDGCRRSWRWPDQSFDVVVAQYVITAVPDPEATLDEFARVIRPGGEIMLVNHIGAESGPRAAVRAMLRAAGAPARLAAGIPLRPPGLLGRAPRRRARDRTPADAAARAISR